MRDMNKISIDSVNKANGNNTTNMNNFRNMDNIRSSNGKRISIPAILFLICGLSVSLTVVSSVASAGESEKVPSSLEKKPISVESAREKAKLMQKIYLATLEIMHDHYFHGERAVVPARAMEDVFENVKGDTNSEANWISVNMKAMSIGHRPKTEFEKTAAKEIAKGKGAYEAVADGYYRRAAAVPLNSNCVGCHGGLFKTQSKKPKFAGLIISIPVNQKSAGKISVSKK